jgi:uncharacterized protein YggE
MRRTSLAAGITIVALAAAACTPQVTVQAEEGSVVASGTETEASSGTGIAVTGTGEVSGTPDTLTMTFGVSVLRDTVAEAVAQSAERTDAVIAALEAAGVAKDDIQTTNFSIFPEYDYSGDRQRLTGFRVDNSVVADIRDVGSAGDVIDDAVAAGGDEVIVSGVSFSIEDDADLVEAARAEAWADAQAKAEQLADLAGVTLGEPVTIAETLSAVPGPVFFGDAAVAEAREFATPIEPGQEQVEVTLTVRFAIAS